MIRRFPLSFKRLLQFGQFIGLFLACATLVIACKSQTTPPSQTPTADNGRITIGTTLKPRTIDPGDSYELSGLMVIYNLGETLYTYELGTTTLKPLLATSLPKISADGLTYKIPLRQGVTFHDGTPFDGKAMAFSLQRFSENGGKPSFLLADVIDKVEATGNYEITIKLKKPFAAFTSLLAFPGASALSPKAYTIGKGKFNPTTFVGTGPYKLAEFNSDSLRLDAFDKYWGAKPKNKGIELQIYASNPANLYNALQTGSVQVAYQSLEPKQVDSLQQQSDKWQIIEASGTTISYMVLNLKSETVQKKEVREAIAAMIDRQQLIKRVLQGQGNPLYSLVPTSFKSYKPVFQEGDGNGNLEKAKELLKKAGYSATNPAIVEIWHPTGSTTRSIVAATLKAIAEKDLGGLLQFEPKTVESASFFGQIGKGIYPTALADWYPDFLDPDNYIAPFLECVNGSSRKGCEEGGAQSQGSFYYNEQMNQLIDRERKEQNPQKREAIFGEIQTLLGKDIPYIPLWETKDYAFAQKGISGVTINPSQNFPFWTIQKD